MKSSLHQKNLLELLSELEDPRRSQGRMHNLSFILITSIMALMNGAVSFYAIRDFLEINKKDLFKLFKMKGKQKRLPLKSNNIKIIFLY